MFDWKITPQHSSNACICLYNCNSRNNEPKWNCLRVYGIKVFRFVNITKQSERIKICKVCVPKEHYLNTLRIIQGQKTSKFFFCKTNFVNGNFLLTAKFINFS